MAQLDSASASGAEGYRFESCRGCLKKRYSEGLVLFPTAECASDCASLRVAFGRLPKARRTLLVTPVTADTGVAQDQGPEAPVRHTAPGRGM